MGKKRIFGVKFYKSGANFAVFFEEQEAIICIKQME